MKKIGIGYENYKRIIDDGCYYIDKTILIRDIIEKGGIVTLFTRPRRFVTLWYQRRRKISGVRMTSGQRGGDMPLL